MSYHQISNDDRGEEERNARRIAHQHAIPHGFDPFAAQHAEHNHERVHEIRKVPPGQLLVRESIHVICHKKKGTRRRQKRRKKKNSIKSICSLCKNGRC